jgi:hypothetical protein
MADRLKDVIYCAGFFDGEGSVGVYRRKYICTVSNTDIRPLKKFVELWGGKIGVNEKSKIKNANMDVYYWHCYGQQCKDFLNEIFEFSIVKKDQIKLFLEVLEVLPIGRGKRRSPGVNEFIDLHAERIRRLKRIG